MRYMIIVKATADTEAGVMPTEELLQDMQQYHAELAEAGVLVDGSGLKPSAKGWRIRYSGDKGRDKRTYVDGPFAETKELIAGFWIWQVKDMEEAIEWVKRMPHDANVVEDIEIRPVFEAEDFGAELTPELRAQEDRLRAETEARLSAK